MSGESRDRRSTDQEIADLRVIVANHIGSCTELNKVADQRHRDNLERMDRMDGKLDRLVKASDDRDAVVRVIKRALGWGAAGGSAIVGTWGFVEHAWPVVKTWLSRSGVAVLMVAWPAHGHDDDPVLRDLQNPATGGSCCHERDCALTDDWDLRQGAYVVRLDGAWVSVPDEIVIRDHRPHPSGRAVLCKLPSGTLLCFLPGAPQT